MRKIIVYNVISLDGYHTGSGNDVSVMFPMMGKVFDSYNAELLRRADVAKVLIGQRALLPDRAWDAVMRSQFPSPGR